MQTRSTQHGFTLVEMIVSLVILGVVAMVGTLGMAEVMRSYVMTSDHSSMSQKTQVALARMYLELQHLAEVTASGDTTITYRPRFTFAQGVLAPAVIAYNAGAGTLTLDGNVLLDNVQQFELRYCTSSDLACNPTASFDDELTQVIEVNVVVGGADTNGTGDRVPRVFQTRVQPVIFHFS